MQNTIKVLIVAVTSMAFAPQVKADAAAVKAARDLIEARGEDKITENHPTANTTSAKSDSQSVEARQARMTAELEKVRMDRAAGRSSQNSSFSSPGRDDAATATRGVSVKDRAAAWGKKAEGPAYSAGAADAQRTISGSTSIKDRAAAWGKKAEEAPALDGRADSAATSVRSRAAAWGKKVEEIPASAPMETEAVEIKTEAARAREKRIEAQKAAGAKIQAARIAANAKNEEAQEIAFQQLKGGSNKAATSDTEEETSEPTAQIKAKKAHHKETVYERKERMHRSNYSGGHGGKGRATGIGHG